MGVIIFSFFLFIIDQLSKYFVVNFLKDKPPLVVIKNFLNFFYLENRGAAFGIMQDKGIFFTIITVIVVCVLTGILFKNYNNKSKPLKFAVALILGGTIGNFVDRIRLKYVIDFISVKIFNYDFAVFNLADSFIVIGTIILVIIILLYENPKRK
ncbi:signal peptidase II [Peptoniphilus sp. oral taxon 386]|uniref:signal peptidase II n=1 Tax=Peptoniphilus sp. oral taxon 386 TaxID=652713 RepID=UPI0003096B4B|nr:signal peptidase II [Peptoniphilus sp. oral taxon 386]